MSQSKPKLDFSITFEKDEPKINAETYAQSLISVSTIIREVNYQEGQGGNLSVNIVAEEEGSFFVALELIEQVTNNAELFSQSIQTLGAVVDIFVGLITLKKYLSKDDGTEIKVEGDVVNLVNENGDNIYQTNNITYNLYESNQAIHDSISQQFSSLDSDESLRAVKIDKAGSSVTVTREEFSGMAKKVILTVEETEEVDVEAELVVRKIVVDNPERKWEFIHQGLPISATIKDSSFWDKILNGEVRFANGDRLICTLKIIREFDQATNTFLNKDYVVTDVRQHHPRQVITQTRIQSVDS